VLAGREDNAAVYKVSNDLAVVQTVDYITPVVDDPYQYGMIAAANAISDIYAMGATPAFALNIVGYPNQSLPLSILGQILKGGADKAAEAGIAIIGGHSITDHAPKYGLVVTGFVNPSRMISKKGAKPGNALILTKPLGIGVITTGIDRKLVNNELIGRVTKQMTTLNKQAAEIMQEVGVNACTDVTGFGLLGHLREILIASGTGACITASKVPIIPETEELIQAGAVSGGTHNNYRYLRDLVEWDTRLSKEVKLILCDPQTSGGLLIAVPQENKNKLLKALQSKEEVLTAVEIGEVVEGPGQVSVVV
jgi:selenide,water dikinase